MDKDNKKNSRQFDLEKKSSRSFDLEKKSARSFDLEKDPVQPSVGSNLQKEEKKLPPQPPIDGGFGDGGNSSSKKKLWIAIAVVAIAVVAFFIAKSCGIGNVEEVVPVADSTNTVEKPVDTTTSIAETDANAATESDQGSNKENATAPSDNADEATTGRTSEPVSAATTADIQRAADRVLDGEFGNGKERKQMLGASYNAIQNRVNEMYRLGLAPKK